MHSLLFLPTAPSKPSTCVRAKPPATFFLAKPCPLNGRSSPSSSSVSFSADPLPLPPLILRASNRSFTHLVSCSHDRHEILADRGGVYDRLQRITDLLSSAFPLWVSFACFSALRRPSYFLWFRREWQVLGLTLTMLGMGMTLTVNDLRAALSMPRELLTGFVLQYTVMPFSGAVISRLLNLPSHYAAGLILVACCPGGTASNIVTYLARGNVALSVLMTAASTMSAVVLTPFLTAKLAGQYVAVDATGLFMSTFQVVLAPVLVGAIMNQYFHGFVMRLSPFMPLVAVFTVAILCANAIAQNASAILISGQQVVMASCVLHTSGFFFGLLLSRLLRIDVASSRTISIEVGMQNSVLGVVLAGQHFSNPLTAVPCAVSSVCHSVIGSILAGIWRATTPDDKKE
ncbi:probable sodium/metabolite cotransporter BASS1, chloroplastic [Nymphaea colorata]|nr:probable sodium/metabolite cotransporter BASS1, chloroplastic [Nymphaea colorata]